MMRVSRPIIALLTDFGSADAYVAAMKGVILGIHPDATLVDVTHDIAPQNVSQLPLSSLRCIGSFPLTPSSLPLWTPVWAQSDGLSW